MLDDERKRNVKSVKDNIQYEISSCIDKWIRENLTHFI
jgi:hypothetical protein